MSFLPTMGSLRSPSVAIVRVLLPTGIAVALLAGFGVVRPDRMLVEHVEIVGAHEARPGELRHLADIPNGTTVWGVDLGDVHAGVVRHPWVRSAEVSWEWPDTVRIVVEEYQPVALLRRDALYYVDRSGEVFLKARPEDLDYPVLSGTRDLERLHPDLPGLVVRDALWLIDALDSRGLVDRGVLSEVAFSRTRGFTATLTTGAELRFAVDGLDRQVGRLASLLAEGVDLRRPMLVDLAPDTVAIVRDLTEKKPARRAPVVAGGTPVLAPAVAPSVAMTAGGGG